MSCSENAQANNPALSHIRVMAVIFSWLEALVSRILIEFLYFTTD